MQRGERPNCGKACRAAWRWLAGAALANHVDNKMKPKDCVLAVCAPKQIRQCTYLKENIIKNEGSYPQSEVAFYWCAVCDSIHVNLDKSSFANVARLSPGSPCEEGMRLH